VTDGTSFFFPWPSTSAISTGVTLLELMTATGWQAHSVRGFLSAAVGKKMGLHLDSSKREDGRRVYRMG
jgi:hypothetical protein